MAALSLILFSRPAVQASAGGPDRGGGDEAEGALRLLLRLPCRRPGLGQVTHGLINHRETNAKCRHQKKLTCKGTLPLVFIFLRPSPLLGFCLGWLRFNIPQI
jgi:hypothetical protein